MNLNKQFEDKLRGGLYKKSFPKDESDAKEPETLKNILINVLALAPIEDKREIFYANYIANDILRSASVDGDLILPEEFNRFLIRACYDSIIMFDKEKKINGFYPAHLMSQVLEELGEKSNL